MQDRIMKGEKCRVNKVLVGRLHLILINIKENDIRQNGLKHDTQANDIFTGLLKVVMFNEVECYSTERYSAVRNSAVCYYSACNSTK